MKKTIAILLSMFMILSLAACGNSADRTGKPAAEYLGQEEKASGWRQK